MKKILVITSSYLPKASANGICINQILKCMLKKGYEIHIICPRKNKETKEEIIANIKIHRVSMPLFLKMQYLSEGVNTVFKEILYNGSMIIMYIKLILYLPFFPLTSIIYVLEIIRVALKLDSEIHFDAVISTYVSLEACIAGTFLKKIRNLKFLLYLLDSISGSVKGRFLSRDFIDKKGWFWEKYFYENADNIFVMKCHEKKHKNKRYAKYFNKIHILDFPLLKRIRRDDEKIQKTIQIAYLGSLHKTYRNPKYACEIFSSLKSLNFILNFYSRGDAENILREYAIITEGKIKQNGYIEYGQSLKVLEKVDCLLSIGNSITEMVPSKIFEYISTGKPIIHLYSNNDSSLYYLKKYPLAININMSDDFMNNKQKIELFLKEHRNKFINFDQIEQIYFMNDPEYSAMIFDNYIKERKNSNNRKTYKTFK